MTAPRDKRAQAKAVGEDLARHHGRKRYYSVEEVKAANRRLQLSVDACCWSHAMFNTRADFDEMHQQLGETCDYVSMKAQMLSAVGSGADVSWFDFDLSWLEFPDIDWSLFDFLDFS
jgi:hypothetical protein